MTVVRELAPAKVNLVLRVGSTSPNGLHEICSLFASLELHDVVDVEVGGSDRVHCPGVEGPNLASAAIDAFRREWGALPPLLVRIDKRIPVAAGLGGGSADAAAVLRAANAIAGGPFEADGLRAIAAPLGSDVPSQIEPAHAIVRGTGELVEPVRLPALAILLACADAGLATAAVFRRADELGIPRADLECADLDAIAGADGAAIAGALENDLQQAALALRPELADVLAAVRSAGALGALVSGSGPTVFGVFAERAAAERAAAQVPGALVTMVARR